MRYTGGMQTKIGVHYHISVGPDVVSRLGAQPLNGPYVDLVVADYREAVTMLESLIIELPVGHIDNWDLEDLNEYMEHLKEHIMYGEIPYGELGIEENGFEINIGVCAECIPKGTN